MGLVFYEVADNAYSTSVRQRIVIIAPSASLLSTRMLTACELYFGLPIRLQSSLSVFNLL